MIRIIINYTVCKYVGLCSFEIIQCVSDLKETMAQDQKMQGEIANNEIFVNDIVEGFILTKDYSKNRHVLDDWEVHEEDIWIAGSPKAGTTWTQEMVWLIANDLDYEGAKKSIQERTPHWEDSTVMDIRPLGVERNVEIPLYRADSLRFIKETKENGKPQRIKTHMAFNFLPKQIKDGSKKPKIVFVARNPKDSCVSLYYYLKSLLGLDSSLDDFAEKYITEAAYGPQWDHTISYWKERHRTNLLIIRYEEMIEDLPVVLRKVAEFLEKKFTDEQFKELADHLSFQNMKNNPAVNFTNLFELFRKLKLNPGKGVFLRSGKIGSHKSELSPELIKKFDKISLEKTRESGWNFF